MGERAAKRGVWGNQCTSCDTRPDTWCYQRSEDSTLDWEESTSPQFQPMGTHKPQAESNEAGLDEEPLIGETPGSRR